MSKFISFVCVLLILNTIKSEDKLVFVMTHFRHGARAPTGLYEKYNDYVKERWTNPGELTGSGQRMHYLLGLRNRIRYVENFKFLSEKFDPHEILIYSSPFNRTINSVASQLQGLYPQSAKKGEVLTDAQEKLAVPQIDISAQEIQEEIKNLNKNALPNSMMLAPIRMINLNEKKIILYDIDPCTKKRDEIKKKNSETLDTLKNIVKTFQTDYRQYLDKLYQKTENYDIGFLDRFCDSFIASYTDGRELSAVTAAGFDKDKTRDFCYEFQKLNFRDWISGDKEHVLAHVEVSKLMREFIHYMRQRIDADIKGEKIDEKYEDYSKPKMLIVSGHDSTVSCYEIFLMEVFGYPIDFYVLPKFATQIAFEITTSSDQTTTKTYADYKISFYFNDDLKFTKTVNEFIEKVTPHIWSDEKVDQFCGFEEEKTDKKEDEEEGESSDFEFNKLCIIFFVFFLLFMGISIFLIIKIIRTSSTKIPNEPLVSSTNSSGQS